MPPADAGAVQLIPIVDPVVIAGKFFKFVGTSGLVKMTAPFPIWDAIVVPTKLVAVIYEYMLYPQGKLNGALVSIEIGTVQLVAAIILALAPLQ